MSTTTNTRHTSATVDPLNNLQKTTLGNTFTLVLQCGLGISYNLYGKTPTPHSPVSIFHGPVLVLHEIVGLLVLGGSVHTLLAARITRNRVAAVSSALAVRLLTAAVATGFVFLRNASTAASMTMGTAGTAALLCLVNLAVAGRRAPLLDRNPRTPAA